MFKTEWSKIFTFALKKFFKCINKILQLPFASILSHSPKVNILNKQDVTVSLFFVCIVVLLY